MKYFLAVLLCLAGIQATVANTEPATQQYLVELTKEAQLNGSSFLMSLSTSDSQPEALPLSGWYLITANTMDAQTLDAVKAHPDVAHVQKNYILGLKHTFMPSHPLVRKQIIAKDDDNPFPFPFPPGDGGGGGGFPGMGNPPADNPEIPGKTNPIAGNTDPMFAKQWGMNDIGVKQAWQKTMGAENMVVAVIDTGVDYTHEDIVDNLWRNEKEIPNNNIDDDNNGYVDDVIGWDFVSNDNKPFDLASSMFEMLTGGGNPGHGTHCAGNVAARAENGKGVAGVAPNVKIMPLRFISEKGQGTTADAIKAIKYAVDNGARVTSNSWGSNGEDPNEGAENKALRDVIQYAQDHNVLFVAAAGNGDAQGNGYDNDTSNQPSYPATYDHDAIISVAAIDSSDNFGKFSNWGARTVDIAAPGVKVFSTTVGSNYSDTVLDIPGLITATWDGTSMATPHVAGAAALYWSKHPEQNWKQVKTAILNSAKKISSASGKTVSGGKLDVNALLNL